MLFTHDPSVLTEILAVVPNIFFHPLISPNSIRSYFTSHYIICHLQHLITGTIDKTCTERHVTLYEYSELKICFCDAKLHASL